MVGLWVAVSPGFVDEEKHAPRVVRIIGDQQAAFTRRDVFALLQAETANVAPGADRLSLMACQESLRAVFDNRNLARAAKIHDGRHVTRVSK